MNDSTAVLARYAASMRRKRIGYFTLVAVMVIGLGVFARIAYSRGEVAHASLHTVSRAPAALGLDSASPDQQQLWRTGDHVGAGTPLSGGTVITYSTHTVRGRDARTGTQTWSYTRTDRTVCNAIQLDGTTVAVFAVHGNCDEVSAFDSGTGARRWARTLDKDGMPLDGHPTYQWAPSTLMITSRTAIYAINPSTGVDIWTYTRFGCRIDRAVLGSSGALISQNCTTPRCKNVKFCQPGPQLLLRDAMASNGEDSKPNADQLKWNDFGNTDVPVSADQVISAANRTTRELDTFRAANGKPATSVRLSPAPASLSTGALSAASATIDAEVVWIDGTTYVIRDGRSTPVWSASTLSAPTVVSNAGQQSPALPAARITVPTADGVAELDGNTGKVRQRFPVPAPGTAAIVYPLGAGLLVADSAGVVAYR